MTAIELDPVFVRALRLLHSKSKDSTSQLKSMLDEAIRHRKGLGPGPTGFGPSSPQQRKRDREGNGIPRKDADKRSLDKLKHELSELVPTSKSAGGGGDAGMFGKRPRLDSPRSSSAGFSSKSHTPSPTPPGSAAFDSKGHNNSSGSSEAEEMAMGVELDMNLEGLGDCTCCICKSFNQESGNKLMECHTCQNLFHQGCHDPPVSNEEANDPRLVWNCSECLRKQPSLKPTTLTKGHTGLNVLKGSAGGSRASPSKTDLSSSGSLFKKEKGSGKPSGMSALAASYKTGGSSGKSSSGSSRSSRSSSSSSSGVGSSSSSSIGADRRMQMMKKIRKIK